MIVAIFCTDPQLTPLSTKANQCNGFIPQPLLVYWFPSMIVRFQERLNTIHSFGKFITWKVSQNCRPCLFMQMPSLHVSFHKNQRPAASKLSIAAFRFPRRGMNTAL